MKNGKVSQSVQKRSLFLQLQEGNPHVLQGAGPGRDYAALGAGAVTVVSACGGPEPAGPDLAFRSVCAAVNNLAASGGQPSELLCQVLLPATEPESTLRELMRDLQQACRQIGAEAGLTEPLQIAGGGTGVTRQVKAPILTVTAIGLVPEEKRLSSRALKPGMTLLMAGYAGLSGTALLAKEKRAELTAHFPVPFVDRATALMQDACILKAAGAAVGAGAAGLHDVGEGGIYGALWEMAEASGVGLTVDLKAIPIRQETVEISEFFDINPYKLYGRGGLLIAAEDGERVQMTLREQGIACSCIGTCTDSHDRLLLNGEEQRFLETVQMDEIYKGADR